MQERSVAPAGRLSSLPSMSTTTTASSSTLCSSNPLQNPAYVLENIVSHNRLLPREAAHAFAYPTLALLVSLSHLEDHSLDIAHGRILHYNRNGKRWWIPRLLSIRPGAYLEDVLTACAKDTHSEPPTIRVKLESVLSRYGHDASQLSSVWMMTMPSYMGIEGINPLTVYYCYQNGSTELWLVVLEVCRYLDSCLQGSQQLIGAQHFLRATCICTAYWEGTREREYTAGLRIQLDVS